MPVRLGRRLLLLCLLRGSERLLRSPTRQREKLPDERWKPLIRELDKAKASKGVEPARVALSKIVMSRRQCMPDQGVIRHVWPAR